MRIQNFCYAGVGFLTNQDTNIIFRRQNENCIEGTGERKSVEHLGAVSVGSSELSVVALIYALTLVPFLYRLKDRVCRPTICRISLPYKSRARVSVYANVSIFVSQRH